MDSTEMAAVVEAEIKGLSTNFDSDDYTNAMADAARESWALPVTSDFRVYWFKQRTKRHLFFYLLNQYVDEIQHKQTKHQQRFEHLRSTVKDMDKAYAEVQEARPDEFSDVDAFDMFGTYIKPGFRYDDVGRDVTYSDVNEVIFDPNDAD